MGAPEPLSEDTLLLLTLPSDLRKALEKKGLISDPFEVKPDFTHSGTESFESHLRMSRKPKNRITVRVWAEDATKPRPTQDYLKRTSVTRPIEPYTKPTGANYRTTFDKGTTHTHHMGKADTDAGGTSGATSGTTSDTTSGATADTSKTKRGTHKRSSSAPVFSAPFVPDTPDPAIVKANKFTAFILNLPEPIKQRLVDLGFVDNPDPLEPLLTAKGEASLNRYCGSKGLQPEEEVNFGTWARLFEKRPLARSAPSKIPPAGPKTVAKAKVKVVPLVKTSHASSAAPPAMSPPVLGSPPAAPQPQPLSKSDINTLAHKFWEALFKTGAETIFKVLRTTDFITQYEAPKILDAIVTQAQYPGISAADLERLKTQIWDELFGNPLRLKIGPNTCSYELRQISKTYGITPPDLSFQPVF